ncbi:MAG: hypothetical protein E7298_04500 [Lachnospiraceae bacterium]|nr:hypothetical protein [Lachnospiraceae bacterium]
MKNRLQKVTSVTAFLLCLMIITGSLASCGSVSFADGKAQGKGNSAEYEQSIEVESSVEIPMYYAGEEEVIYQADEITSYSVNVWSNDDSFGTVEYETGYTDGRQTVTATATPAEGYVLDCWMVNGEEAKELGDNESVSVTDITGDINLVAVFADSDSGLSQEQMLLSMTPSLRASGLLGAPATNSLPAQPVTGDPRGQLPSPDGNYIGESFHRIFVYVAPGEESKGTVSGGYIGGDNTSTIINAVPGQGYEFDHWRIIEIALNSTKTGETFKRIIRDYNASSSSVTIHQTQETDTIFVTWCFAFFRQKGKYSVRVVNDPPSGGTSTIQEQDTSGADVGSAVTGQAEITSGNTAVITATPATEYKFDCFVTQDGTRVSGTANGSGGYTLTLKDVHQDITITAKYKSTSKVNVTIQASPEKGGKVKYNSESAVSSGTYEYNPSSESAFTLTAIPATGYKFLNWEDSVGNVFNSKEIGISGLSEDRTYTAIFVSESSDEDAKGLRVVAEPASGGHVRKKASATAGMVDITAYPNRGWNFVGWKKDGGTIFSKSKKATVADESVTYVGVFEKDENYRATTDLVDEHFYNDKRSFTEPNYTVTRQTMENLAAVSVSYDKLRNANDLPALHSYGAVASVRDYFDRKLSASDIVLAEGILTTTKGEVIPLEKIKDIDALMNSAKSISLDKFGERYDSEIVAAIYTEPPEEFDGLVRTYLWKETGAQKGDNIYVMYRDKGLSYQEMAAVVDDDGTVRFTLEDALVGTEFVLVRVNIESKHLPS